MNLPSRQWIDIRRRLSVTSIALAILVAQSWWLRCATAEESATVSPMMRDLVPSWPIDLTMTREDERAIVLRLAAPCPPIPHSMTLSEFASHLESVCPVYLNAIALEGIGLSPDARVQALSSRTGTTWITQLITTLRSVDLTVQLQHNVLHLTTEEDAQNHYPARTYNITSLIGTGEIADQHGGVDSLMQLVQTHVSPDAWEVLGGMGTMTPSFHQNETLLTVSASTPMHWQIQTLLNQLIVAGKVPILDLPPSRTRPSRFMFPTAQPSAISSGLDPSTVRLGSRRSGLPTFEP